MWAFVMSRSMQKASSRMALSSLGSRWTGVGGSSPMVGCARFIDQKVYKLVTNFQTSLEQNIVSGPTPLRINNAPVHVSQTYPGLVWSPEPRYIQRGHVNQADTGSKMAIWVSWAYGHQIMRIRIRQKRFEILKVHIKLFRLRQQFSFVRRPEHGRIGV